MSSQNQKSQGKNYYEILGLKENATQQEIDEAYKKLSKQWHPEKNSANRKQAEAKFHDISEAYEVLSNRNSRTHYDEMSSRSYTDEDAERTFQQFFQEHGMMDENEKKFFDQYYPDRKKNAYEILGVPKNATQQDIDAAYRKLAIQFHPKNNQDPNAKKKFNQINEAYNNLRNDTRRRSYDSMLFGQITPFRANDIFENFWTDRWNELEEEADSLFRPLLRNRWTRNLDRAFSLPWFNDDWSNVREGESQKVSTYYTNRNGVENKKTISTKTRYENGIPKTETIEQYQFPDGKKEVRKMIDDGKGNVTSNVYHLKKGQTLPIGN